MPDGVSTSSPTSSPSVLLLRHQPHPHVYMTNSSCWGRRRDDVSLALQERRYFFPLVGAVVSDVFWGKFRTIMTFSSSTRRVRDRRRSCRDAGLLTGLFWSRSDGRHQAVRVDQRGDQSQQEPAPHRARVSLLPRDQRRLVHLDLLLPRPSRQVRAAPRIRHAGR